MPLVAAAVQAAPLLSFRAMRRYHSGLLQIALFKLESTECR
jgi:hypothetical protein